MDRDGTRPGAAAGRPWTGRGSGGGVLPVRAARHAQIAVYGLSRGLGEKFADPTHPVLCTIVSVIHGLPEAPLQPFPAEDGLAPPHVAFVQCLLIAALLGGGVRIVRRQNLVRPFFSRLRLRSQTEDRPVRSFRRTGRCYVGGGNVRSIERARLGRAFVLLRRNAPHHVPDRLRLSASIAGARQIELHARQCRG